MEGRMSGQDLFQELLETLARMEGENIEMRHLGRKFAEAERDYRVALAVKILGLRAEGMPVTITPDLARGDDDVSELRLKRDAAKTEWEASKQAHYTLSMRARILDAQLGREWRAS